MNDQIDAETLQQKKQDEIKIPANEKKNITHRRGIFNIKIQNSKTAHFRI